MIAFAINYYERDAELAKCNARILSSIYPDATVCLIDDMHSQLKHPPHAGAWTERWMLSAMATGADIIIKLDPDCRATRTLTEFPTTDLFGQFTNDGAYHVGSTGILSGGCIGFQRHAVERILASGLLHDAKYNDKPYLCDLDRYQCPVILNDPIVADVAQQLQLTQGPWADISMKMFWEKPEHKPGAAFVHPVLDCA